MFHDKRGGVLFGVERRVASRAEPFNSVTVFVIWMVALGWGRAAFLARLRE